MTNQLENKNQYHNGNHWPHSISGFVYFEFDIIFCKEGKKKKRKIIATENIYNTRKDSKYS